MLTLTLIALATTFAFGALVAAAAYGGETTSRDDWDHAPRKGTREGAAALACTTLALLLAYTAGGL